MTIEYSQAYVEIAHEIWEPYHEKTHSSWTSKLVDDLGIHCDFLLYTFDCNRTVSGYARFTRSGGDGANVGGR